MDIKHKKISYIAEINLKSKSAYKHQVLKMCDAFSQKGFKVKLFIINSNKIRFSEIKKNHLLKSNFKIIEIYNSINHLNFLTRLLFSFKISFKIKNKSEVIFSRSVLTSILLSIFGVIIISNFYLPIDWNEPFVVPNFFTYGLILSLIISLIFISIYVYLFANSSRHISEALSQTRFSLANKKE